MTEQQLPAAATTSEFHQQVHHLGAKSGATWVQLEGLATGKSMVFAGSSQIIKLLVGQATGDIKLPVALAAGGSCCRQRVSSQIISIVPVGGTCSGSKPSVLLMAGFEGVRWGADKAIGICFDSVSVLLPLFSFAAAIVTSEFSCSLVVALFSFCFVANFFCSSCLSCQDVFCYCCGPVLPPVSWAFHLLSIH
ncbi:hypothetical protein RHGRI_004979 [Rhododendron griersonianum]|uniref:AT-hook motif nuclear-localized protein n=1 Tax=Rhododendron griersonianum TaxID=479676 RepID=A0AAV6LDU9_9ERIC|nr:hypothetical protein RHGRI_004979 [Rhododendron griersonianum]